MKVWKGLFFVTLLLCATLFVVGVSAADDGTHTHPICGATHKEIGDHTGSCEAVEWTAWDGTSDIAYGENNTAYVYLSDNATRSKSLTVTGNTLYLCLNGKTLTGSIWVEGDATLNICDCKGGGEITRTSACAVEVRTVTSSNAHTTLNLYGGKISSNSISDNGSIVLHNNAGYKVPLTVAVFNMYGGEVYNGDSGASAVYVSFAKVGTSYYELNMYGGSITTNQENGVDLNNNKNVTMKITGGVITGNWYAVNLCSGNTLTLSGNPKFITSQSNGTEIYLPEDVSFIVTDDFAPAGGTTISVKKPVDATGSVVFAMSASGSSLSDKAQYFVSAEEGYFVECSTDGNLYLTACAITEQPTKDNSYTVSANGNPRYQWYGTKRGVIPVTDENAKAEVFFTSWKNQWNYFAPWGGDSVTLKAFTLYMAAGDELTLSDVSNSGYYSITGISLTDSDGGSVTAEEEAWDYRFTAPKDGEYTVEITAEWMVDSDDSYMQFSFAANVTGDVVGDALSGQTDKTLNPETLGDGKYMCAVTWEDKTTLYTNAVEFHKHTWNDGEVTTEPTCTTAGEKTFICTTCNETKTETIDALGHDFTGGTWEHDADEHWKKCSRCGEIGAKSDHDWNDGEVTTDPTCLATGVRTLTCTECSATKEETEPALGHDFEGGKWQSDANQHWKKCSRCEETDTKSAHDWNDGEVTTKPTCTVAGVRTLACTECSATKEEAEPALGHDLIHHEAKAATCTEKGWDAYDTCSRCDYTTYKENAVLGHDFEGGEWKHDESQHWKQCSRCDVTDTKSAHDWNEGEVTTKPTCTVAGVRTFTCTECSATKEETEPALGHDLIHHEAKAATCTEKGWDAYDTCSRCDYTTYKENAVLGHDFEGGEWKHDESQHWKQCSRCDVTDTKSAHKWNDGEVTTKSTCTVAGVRTFTCTECSATKEETEPALGHDLIHHEAKAATCTEKGWDAYDTCSRCDYTTYKENPVLGHDFEGGKWQSDANQHWKQCSRCEKTDTKSAHDWNDGKVTTNPTCLATGVKTFTCTKCSATKEETLDALGHDFEGGEWKHDESQHWKQCSRCEATTAKSDHDWDDGVETKAPTCTETGVKTFTCTKCSATKEETLDALGHDFEGGEWKHDENQHWKQCSRCDAIDEKSNHDWNDGEETKAPTCTETGVKIFTCTECSATKEETLDALGHDFEGGAWEHDESQHWKKCSRCEAIDEKSNHDWNDGKVTTVPTCTETGVKTFTCTKCSAKEEKTIDALGHDLKHHEAKAATCTETGWDAYDTCSRCDHTTYKENPALGHDFKGGEWKSDENHHWKQCSRCEETDTKSAHEWNDGEVTTAPTCTTTGVKTFTCTECSATEEETIAALGHDLIHHDAKAATCTEKGWIAYDSCSRCDYTTYEEKDALGHDFTADTWEHDANNHWKKCSRCDAIDAKAGHTGGTATCKDSAVCTVCSEAYGARDPRNHAGGVEIRGMAEATTKKEGHTGDSYCKGCNAKLSEGTVIPVISDLSTDKKSDLRSAVEEMEKALSDRSDVYTEEQKELLTDSINATKAALKSIENAEEAVKRVDAMPAADKTRPDDEAAIGAYEAAKKAYDDLSADEKRMAGERTKEALDAMLKALTDYDITNGNGSTWTADDKKDGLTFTVNGYHKKFAGVVINGTVIDPKYYDIKVGSTVITLKPEYLETLSAGEYTLLVRYTDGSTDGKDTFTITKAAAADPDAPTALKGEDYALLVMACGVALLLIGIAVLIRYFDKRRQER